VSAPISALRIRPHIGPVCPPPHRTREPLRRRLAIPETMAVEMKRGVCM